MRLIPDYLSRLQCQLGFNPESQTTLGVSVRKWFSLESWEFIGYLELMDCTSGNISQSTQMSHQESYYIWTPGASPESGSWSTMIASKCPQKLVVANGKLLQKYPPIQALVQEGQEDSTFQIPHKITHWQPLIQTQSPIHKDVLVAESCPTLCDPMVSQPPSFLCPWNSPSKNTRVGSHSLLQRIFLTQGWNPGLLRCRQILYHLSHHSLEETLMLGMIEGKSRRGDRG